MMECKSARLHEFVHRCFGTSSIAQSGGAPPANSREPAHRKTGAGGALQRWHRSRARITANVGSPWRRINNLTGMMVWPRQQVSSSRQSGQSERWCETRNGGGCMARKIEFRTYKEQEFKAAYRWPFKV
jgi:hypothetical protein